MKKGDLLSDRSQKQIWGARRYPPPTDLSTYWRTRHAYLERPRVREVWVYAQNLCENRIQGYHKGYLSLGTPG